MLARLGIAGRLPQYHLPELPQLNSLTNLAARRDRRRFHGSKILEVRLDVVPQSIIKAVMEVDEPEAVKRLHKKAATGRSLEEFKQVVELALR